MEIDLEVKSAGTTFIWKEDVSFLKFILIKLFGLKVHPPQYIINKMIHHTEYIINTLKEKRKK